MIRPKPDRHDIGMLQVLQQVAANPQVSTSAMRGVGDSRFEGVSRRIVSREAMRRRVEIGPLMHERAIAKGGRLLTGGGRHALDGRFIALTVIAGATDDVAIFREETFGPVAAIARFSGESEVIACAKATNYGLVAYFFTRDHDRIQRASNALAFGMIAVNGVKITGAPIPFGAVKESGLGCKRGRHGFDEFTDLKYVCATWKAT